MCYLRLAALSFVGGFRLVACLTKVADVVQQTSTSHVLRQSTAASKLLSFSQPLHQAFVAPGFQRSHTSKTERAGDTEAANKSTSAIVVLGQLLKPDGSATEVLDLRVQKAAEVFEKHGFKPIIVSGGDPQNRGISEALVMQNGLVALGVPAGIVKMETKSNNTLQNALSILDNYGEAGGLLPSWTERLFLVTSNFHLPRAMYLFEAVLVYYHLNSTIALEPVPVAGGCPEPWEVADIKDPAVNQMTLLQRLEQEFYMLSNIEYYMKKDSPPGVTVKPLPESRKQKALHLVTYMITKEKERLGLMEVKAKPCPALQ